MAVKYYCDACTFEVSDVQNGISSFERLEWKMDFNSQLQPRAAKQILCGKCSEKVSCFIGEIASTENKK